MAATVYYFVSTLLLMYIAFLWSKNGFANMLVKMTFTAASIFGIVMSLSAIGVVVVK